MSKPKLTYFDLYGRAEMIRMILHKAKIEFEDNRIGFEEWGKLKEEHPEMFEFGQLPLFERDGVKYAQSASIARMLSIENGFYPTDAASVYRIESIMDALTDWMGEFFGIMFKLGLTEEQ